MPTIRIPHSSPRRGERTYAQLILRVSRRLTVFEGRGFFRTGSLIDEAELRPSPDYPETPMLIEFAGSDRAGRGHNRSNDVHVLWRWNAARDAWDELARVLSKGPEWFHHLAPIVRRELASVATPASIAEEARAASGRIVALLDSELDRLEHEGRRRIMSMLWDQLAARLVPEDEERAA